MTTEGPVPARRFVVRVPHVTFEYVDVRALTAADACEMVAHMMLPTPHAVSVEVHMERAKDGQ